MTETKTKEMTQSDILKLGWTKPMIEKMLPKPTLYDNPYYRNAPPMKKWDEGIVKAAMETAEFKAAFAKASKRREAAKKAVETKTTKTTEAMYKVVESVQVKILPRKKLERNALVHYADKECDRLICYTNREEEYYRMSYAMEHPETIRPDDDATMQRWAVNYIRHCLIPEYEKSLDDLAGKTGKNKAYIICKKGLLKKIAEAYPYYADECERQAERMDSQIGGGTY